MHSEPVGSGEAAFKYLAPYVFRVAISNSRIVKLEAGRVTFKYKDSATDQVRFCTVSAEEFMRRFLQHVLPVREGEVLRIAEPRETTSAEASARSSWSKNERKRCEKRSRGQQPAGNSAMPKLRKRDEADRVSERERPGATLMMTRESSTKLRSMRTPISHGVELEVCASPSNKLLNSIHERASVRPKMKPCKSLPDLGNGKLAERPSSHREATESGRVAEYAAH